MCTSCDPQPVDEQPLAVPETRGGDRLADIDVQPRLPFPDPADVTVTNEDEDE